MDTTRRSYHSKVVEGEWGILSLRMRCQQRSPCTTLVLDVLRLPLVTGHVTNFSTIVRNIPFSWWVLPVFRLDRPSNGQRWKVPNDQSDIPTCLMSKCRTMYEFLPAGVD